MYLIDIDPLDIFSWGIDYGQLLMEEERDSEDLADAFQGVIISRKLCMPSQIAPRRQPNSEKWRNAKRDSYLKFINFIIRLNGYKEIK